MSLLRSPTGSGTNIGRSGSQPNLSSNTMISAVPPEAVNVTFRKRKHPEDCDVQSQLTEIQKQMTTMMDLLTSSINSQNESTTKIRNDIASIKDQMLEIKHGMGLTEKKIANLTIEQTEVKNELQCLTNSVKFTDAKIVQLESDVQKLKITSSTSTSNKTPLDEILNELNDQNLRKKNVIVCGINEPECMDSKERRNLDKTTVYNIFKQIMENCPEPTKNMRVGKYKPGAHRAIKVCFASEETAITILRSKNKLKSSHVKIYPDHTPYQQTYFKKLKNELNQRITDGEENLTIKYINGVPQIRTISSKN